MYSVNKILLSLVVLAIALISISSKGSEFNRNQELLDPKIPPVIDQLPFDIADELEKKGMISVSL